MAKINLLPWREARREQLKQEFLTNLVLAVVFADVFAVAASSDRFLWASANFIFREHNIV